MHSLHMCGQCVCVLILLSTHRAGTERRPRVSSYVAVPSLFAAEAFVTQRTVVPVTTAVSFQVITVPAL